MKLIGYKWKISDDILHVHGLTVAVDGHPSLFDGRWVGTRTRSERSTCGRANTIGNTTTRDVIIFFDEIDGFGARTKCQTRSTSIVSTLLALMDGMHRCGRVVVIGATSRLDAIDPARRRVTIPTIVTLTSLSVTPGHTCSLFTGQTYSLRRRNQYVYQLTGLT
jgi:hypothetical protein